MQTNRRSEIKDVVSDGICENLILLRGEDYVLGLTCSY